jgi:acetyl-CoA carboxylase biotin carboxyl carrier protein
MAGVTEPSLAPESGPETGQEPEVEVPILPDVMTSEQALSEEALPDETPAPGAGEITAPEITAAGSAAGEVTAGEVTATATAGSSPIGEHDTSLLALVDRLAAILERSDLVELEVESGGTGLILRKPEAIAPAPAGSQAGARPPGAAADAAREPVGRPSVKAPLTGIWYAAPSPGSPPYVEVGREVAVGQVIGLIEAMKLFNEIKSDLSGRVVRVIADSGQLVKARQPLIEVEPL